MATITNRAIIETMLANNGRYLDDPAVVKIVEYDNMFNGDVAWGVIYPGEDPWRYHTAAACHNPRTIFER